MTEPKRARCKDFLRITLHDVMDYMTAQYPPKFILGLFNLTDAQIAAALAYIEANRPEVEAEYQTVLKEAVFKSGHCA